MVPLKEVAGKASTVHQAVTWLLDEMRQWKGIALKVVWNENWQWQVSSHGQTFTDFLILSNTLLCTLNGDRFSWISRKEYWQSVKLFYILSYHLYALQTKCSVITMLSVQLIEPEKDGTEWHDHLLVYDYINLLSENINIISKNTEIFYWPVKTLV